MSLGFSRDEKRAMVRALMREARDSSTGWSRANCPFCPKLLGKIDRKQALAINMTNGAFVCFRCGTTGRMRDDEYKRVEAKPEEHHELGAPEGYVCLTTPDGEASLSAEPAREYLRSRKLTRAAVTAGKVGACLSGRYEGRVIVPVLGSEDEWLGWVGRVWFKGAARAYSYPRGMQRGQVLYNHSALLVETDEPVLVVEGVFDALAYWPHAVAVLGKPSETQVYALASARRPVVVVMDGDAWMEGYTLGLKLRVEGQRAGSVKLAPRIDPDEVPHQWLWEQARRSLNE